MSENVEIAMMPGHEHIDLCDLLKLVGWSESGGTAKQLVAAGGIKVDGVVELRKRCKIRPGQVVESNDKKVVVMPAPAPA